MSVRFFLSISSPIEPFPILALHHHFYPDILDVHSWAWSKKVGTESFQTQISNSIANLVFQVGGALCLFRAHHFWSSRELSTCCSLNAGPLGNPRNIPGMSPRNQPWKSDQLLFPVVFFFFWGVYNNLAVSQFISCLPNFFCCILFGNLGTCRALARPWLEPSNQSWRGTSAANGAIPSRNSPQVCACALWVPRLAFFLSRRWLTPCALQEAEWRLSRIFMWEHLWR